MSELGLTEKAEYQEILQRLKEEFKSKMKEVINQEKKAMAKEAAEILGRDFANLVDERKKLIEEFSIESRKVLTYAVKIGLKDRITALTNLTKDTDKNATQRGKATALFAQLVDEVQKYDENIVNPLKEVERKIAENNKKMTELVKQRKPEIEIVEKKYKQKLQKILIEFILDFNKRLAVINKEFGITHGKPISPLDDLKETEGLKISLDNELDEGIFIPADNDDIN